MLLRSLLFALAGASVAALAGADWSRYRGPNGSGVADSEALPAEIGPDRNVVWKRPAPAGISAPIVVGRRLFLTGEDESRLVALAFDAETGEELWRREVERDRVEPHNPLSPPATSTPVADERRVYVFFRDAGLVAFSHEGEQERQAPGRQ